MGKQISYKLFRRNVITFSQIIIALHYIYEDIIASKFIDKV